MNISFFCCRSGEFVLDSIRNSTTPDMSKEAKSMIWDYLVFFIFVIASTFVAVYSRFWGPKEKTKADYVFAAGKVSIAAMMLSIARGTLGVRSFLGEFITENKSKSFTFLTLYDYIYGCLKIPAGFTQ